MSLLKNEINMCGAVITPAAVIKAQVLAMQNDAKEAAYARAHPYAIALWESLALTVVLFSEWTTLEADEMPALREFPRTISGIPLRPDHKLYPDRIIFHDADDEQIAAITCLAIAAGFPIPELNGNTQLNWLFK